MYSSPLHRCSELLIVAWKWPWLTKQHVTSLLDVNWVQSCSLRPFRTQDKAWWGREGREQVSLGNRIALSILPEKRVKILLFSSNFVFTYLFFPRDNLSLTKHLQARFSTYKVEKINFFMSELSYTSYIYYINSS